MTNKQRSEGMDKSIAQLKTEKAYEDIERNIKLNQKIKEIAQDKKTKWYGKWIFTREGVEMYHEFETEAEAKAYVKGCEDAIASTSGSDFDLSEEYMACYDQLEPKDE